MAFADIGEHVPFVCDLSAGFLMNTADVERVARAMCRAGCNLTTNGLRCRDRCRANKNGTVYSAHERNAHAAIAAMQTPGLGNILAKLSTGDPDIWPQIWLAEGYSKADLVADLSALQTWHPIETAPEGETVDLWCVDSPADGGFRVPDCYRSTMADGWKDAGGNYIPDFWPTHWMRAPAPPEASE